MPGAPTFLSVLGDLLCAGTNFFAGVWLEASGPTQVELVVLDWFRELLGMPPGTMGILTERRLRGQPDRPGRRPRTPAEEERAPGRPLCRRAAALVGRSGGQDHGPAAGPAAAGAGRRRLSPDAGRPGARRRRGPAGGPAALGGRRQRRRHQHRHRRSARRRWPTCARRKGSGCTSTRPTAGRPC